MTFGLLRATILRQMAKLTDQDPWGRQMIDALQECLRLVERTQGYKVVNANLRFRLRNEQRLKDVVVELKMRLTEVESCDAGPLATPFSFE